MKSTKEMTFEEKKARVQGFNVIDDKFFEVMMQDPEVAEEVLQIILKDPNLKVVEHHPQMSLRNLNGKSAVLDVCCRFSDGKYCNIEVQKANDDDHQKRVRYNGSLLSSYIAPSGEKYKELPDVMVIYISKFDVFKLKKTVYYVYRVIRGTDVVVNNGFTEIYVNAAIDDGSEIADLMQYFKKSTRENETGRFPKLARRAYDFKNNEEEVDSMCEIMEQERRYGREEGVEEGILKTLLSQYAKGRLTESEFEEDAGMTLEEAKKKLEEKTEN